MTMTTPRPVVPFDPAQIPDAMKAAERWTLWKPRAEDNGTFTKPPVMVSDPRTYADKTKAEHYATFEAAVACLEKNGQRHNLCGLTFHYGGGFAGIDFDDCVDPETREITDPEVAEAIEALNTYTEYSPSGTGLRCVVAGTLPGNNVKSDFVEMWGNASGCSTITGAKLESAPSTVAPAGEALERLYRRAKEKKQETAATGSLQKADQVPGRPATPSAGEVPDEEVLRAAGMNSKKFLTLWNGGGDGGDESRGDLGLADLLAYYCGPSGEAQVTRLMESSGRKRDKFRDRRKDKTYLGWTVAKAYRDRSEYFDWSRWNSSASKKKATQEGHKKKSPAADADATPAGEPACGAASFADTSSLTDVGLARRLALHARGTLRHVEETGEWLGWNGKHYKRDSGLRANSVAKKMSDALWREWSRLPKASEEEQKRRNAARRFVENASSARGVAAAVSLARGEPEIIVSAEELDRHPMLLNVRNGILNLDRIELIPHDPKYLLTQMAGVAFDPKADCPRWRQFIREVMAALGANAEEVAAYLQRLAGLCLTGDVSDHAVNFFFGQGSNGKSVFVATLCDLLGTYAAAAPAELLMSKGQRSREVELLYGGLVGRRLVVVTENELGTRLNEATVKQLCGGDKVLWRRLYADPVETTPTWKIVASANHKPTVRGSDNGIWRRLVPVPWRNSFVGANADPRLTEKLRGELSGILNWCLVGLADWQRRGGLDVPECLREEQKEYRAACDVLGQWLQEKCVTSPGAIAPAGDLFRSFSEWCDDRGENAGTGTNFGIELERLGFRGERPTSGTYRGKTIRHGIGLLHGSVS